MEVIRFTHNYKKLQGQTEATLIGIADFTLNKTTRETYKHFLDYDTAIVGGGHYNLRNGKYIILTFRGNKEKNFTTLRYANPYYFGKVFDRKKWALERMHKRFRIEIKDIIKYDYILIIVFFNIIFN